MYACKYIHVYVHIICMRMYVYKYIQKDVYICIYIFVYAVRQLPNALRTSQEHRPYSDFVALGARSGNVLRKTGRDLKLEALGAKAVPRSLGLQIVQSTSTPQLPLKTPQIPSNRDQKALNRGPLGGLGRYYFYIRRPRVASKDAPLQSPGINLPLLFGPTPPTLLLDGFSGCPTSSRCSCPIRPSDLNFSPKSVDNPIIIGCKLKVACSSSPAGNSLVP